MRGRYRSQKYLKNVQLFSIFVMRSDVMKKPCAFFLFHFFFLFSLAKSVDHQMF